MAKRTLATTKRVIVFYATGKENENHELNWYKIEEWPKVTLDKMQQVVGGNIEILAHKDGWDGPYNAYANEEGLLKQLARNDLAGGALHHLGFLAMQTPLGCAYAGNVILTAKNDKGLTDKAIVTIEKTIVKYRKEWKDG